MSAAASGVAAPARGAPAVRRARESGSARFWRRGAAFGLFAGALAPFLISPMLLTHLGVPYESAGGNPLQKIHPGTLLATLGLGMAAMRFPNLFAFGRATSRVFPGVVVFFCGWVFLLWQTIGVQKMPFTPLIDSFILPMVMLVGLSTQSETMRRHLALAMHVALMADALLGLGEYLLGFRLTPYVAGEFVIEHDWRSTALIGHPLSNAMIIGSYMIILAAGGGRDMPMILRPATLLIALASMVAFGGRTSMVIAILFVVGIFLWRFLRALTGARVNALAVAAGAALAPIMVVAVGALYASGFFEQMIERFVNDNGSAKARLIMLSLFDRLNTYEILFGPDPVKISGLQNLEGIEYGLESFFVAYVLTYGALVACGFFVTIAFFCREVVRASGAQAILPLTFFFVVSATSVSMSAKTTAFGMLVAMILVMLRPTSGRRAA